MPEHDFSDGAGRLHRHGHATRTGMRLTGGHMTALNAGSRAGGWLAVGRGQRPDI